MQARRTSKGLCFNSSEIQAEQVPSCKHLLFVAQIPSFSKCLYLEAPLNAMFRSLKVCMILLGCASLVEKPNSSFHMLRKCDRLNCFSVCLLYNFLLLVIKYRPCTQNQHKLYAYLMNHCFIYFALLGFESVVSEELIQVQTSLLLISGCLLQWKEVVGAVST